jgi:SAM-dependent methyltransferase
MYRVRRKIKKLLLATAPGRAAFHFCRRGSKQSFLCPVCGYLGPFADVTLPHSVCRNALCPKCGCSERHRLQLLVMKRMAEPMRLRGMRALHFAPEKPLAGHYRAMFGKYETADLARRDVDHRLDICRTRLPSASFDCVIASHVLEHVSDDLLALSEISRILKPGGFAILPVPVIVDVTVEYPEPNPFEEMHVRAPGRDYFERYQEYFSRVEILTSSDFPDKYQLFVYEDRSSWPTRTAPLRTAMPGLKHRDFVPICHVDDVLPRK